MRYEDGALVEVPIEAIVSGDRLLVRQGEVVPVDGTVGQGSATIDQSALTGEVHAGILRRGETTSPAARTNSGAAFDLVALRPAAESTYAGIVRLVEEAEKAKAPMVRIADRFAIVFLLVTLVLPAAPGYSAATRCAGWR